MHSIREFPKKAIRPKFFIFLLSTIVKLDQLKILYLISSPGDNIIHIARRFCGEKPSLNTHYIYGRLKSA
jgi:hypothetical protein